LIDINYQGDKGCSPHLVNRELVLTYFKLTPIKTGLHPVTLHRHFYRELDKKALTFTLWT